MPRQYRKLTSEEKDYIVDNWENNRKAIAPIQLRTNYEAIVNSNRLLLCVQVIKLPLGEWVNLASVRGVEIGEDSDSLVPINHLLVRLTRRSPGFKIRELAAGGAFDRGEPLSLFRCESS